MYATLTSKGQVTVPKAIRDKLQLRPGDKIDFILEENGDLRVAAATASVTQLKGMVPRPSSPARLADMDNAIIRAATRNR